MIPLIPIAMQLASYVPSIVKLFNGSDKDAQLAAHVVGIAQAVTGTTGQAPEEALAVLGANPDKQLEFRQTLAAQQADLDKAYLLDMQDARHRDGEYVKAGMVNHRANLLAGGAVALVVFCLAIMVWRSGLDNDAKAVITLILGRALGWVEQVFSFDFGTTRSNRIKDDTINNLTK